MKLVRPLLSFIQPPVTALLSSFSLINMFRTPLITTRVRIQLSIPRSMTMILTVISMVSSPSILHLTLPLVAPLPKLILMENSSGLIVIGSIKVSVVTSTIQFHPRTSGPVMTSYMKVQTVNLVARSTLIP